MSLLVSHPPGYLAERRYILDVLLRDFLGLDYVARTHDKGHVTISLQGSPRGKRLILADRLFQTPEDEWLAASSLPEQPLQVWDLSRSIIDDATVASPKLPVIYGKKLPNGAFSESSKDSMTLGIDVFGSAFFMLTRYEEIVKTTRDQYDRFPASASLAWQEGFLERPIVNEYVEVLWSALKRLWPGLERRQHSHQVRLSHDVDRPFRFLGKRSHEIFRNCLGDVIRRRDVVLAVRRALVYTESLRGRFDSDPYNTFDLILDISEKYGLVSTFNFMAGRTGGDYDATYSLDDPGIRALMRKTADRGHELGLHTSYLTYRDPVRTRQEFEKLLRSAEAAGISQDRWGGRQHYLRWKAPTTWQNWNDSGLTYDSTLSFADNVGFRCGVCWEYPVFNLETRRALRLRERSLVAMEATSSHYMGLSWETSIHTFRELDNVCRLFGGDFTLLWHNTNLTSGKQRLLYEALIEGLVS